MDSREREPGRKGRDAICPSNRVPQRPGTGVRQAGQRPSALIL